ncbi:MAG: alpha/beta hydrolase [Deltaproteobacteria bacterium]|jgi:pimeloyl-ACP methyl ester carboxylesterase|nr:alpha/beta hydrolase [Deltaproteobacteria bacterium]
MDILQKSFSNQGKIRFGHYLTKGKQPVLFIHGFPTSSHLWTETIKNLTNLGHSCGAPDLPGLGDTVTPFDSDYSIDSLATFIFKYYGQYFIKKPVILVGHEIGAAVALTLAIQKPGMLRGIVLTSAAFYKNWPTDLMKGLKFVSKHPVVWQALCKSGLGILRLKKKLLGQIAWDNPEEKEKFEKDIHEFLRPFIYSSTSCSRLRLLLRDLNPKWTMTFASYLHKIKVPSHLVWGSNDKVLNLNEARKLRGDLPQSTLTVLPNAGHLLPLEAPLELARIIHEFSRKIN